MNSKRLLAILLGLSMTISMISVPAYADDTATGGLDMEEGIAEESTQDNTESAPAFEDGSNSYDDFTVDDVEKIDESFFEDIFEEAVTVLQNEEINEENISEENISKEDVSEDIELAEISNESNSDDISLMAVSGTYYADYHIWYDQTSHSITGADNVANITIPSYVDGYIVTSIANNAFLNCTNLQSISIPDTVTSIGYRAFQGCTSLSNIVIPKSVESGSNWFNDCTNLREVTFASGTRTIPDNSLQSSPA